ncbi:MAG: exodeoxyribonuclease VII large subunit [Myxococcota bacterium]
MSAPGGGPAERRVFGVGELLSGLRHLLEDRVGRVWVSGEISNLFRAASGHVYFTLKDADGQLRAALFRNAARRVPFELEDGLEVVVHADATVYEARGELQLVVRQVEPRGQGALQLAFEQLRRRLEAEGLFDAARKRPLPERPGCVGVVTSARGAAVRDVMHVHRRRFPAARLLLAPTRVQGEGAAGEIAAALHRLAGRGDVEVILLVRGGGSLEDLWAFNEEEVVRAIVASPVPVVSGVGHETDVTLADLAADARAATPSAAVVLALPDGQALRDELEARVDRLWTAARLKLERLQVRLDRAGDGLEAASPSARLAVQRTRYAAAHRALVREWEELQWRRRARFGRAAERLAATPPDVGARALRLAGAARALRAAGRRDFERRVEKLGALAHELDLLSPLAVLGRGYGLVRRASDGVVVREAGDAPPGEGLDVRVARARIRAVVEAVSERPDEEA